MRMKAVTRILPLLAIIVAFVLISSYAAAQTDCNAGAGPLDPDQPKGISTDQIIQKFSAQEDIFKEAQTHYKFTLDVTVQTLVAGDTVDGEFRRVSEISFRDGARAEYVTFSPQPSLRRVSLEKDDFQDIDGASSFFLTTNEIPKYNFLYVGQQKVDQIGTYVFDLAPKQLDPDKRYFQGRIWIDDQDLVMVKSCGKTVAYRKPQPKKKPKRGQAPQESVAPTLVSYREQFAGKYWFPTYVRSDESLHFTFGDDVHLREVIKMLNYQPATGSDNAVVETLTGKKKK